MSILPSTDKTNQAVQTAYFLIIMNLFSVSCNSSAVANICENEIAEFTADVTEAKVELLAILKHYNEMKIAGNLVEADRLPAGKDISVMTVEDYDQLKVNSSDIIVGNYGMTTDQREEWMSWAEEHLKATQYLMDEVVQTTKVNSIPNSSTKLANEFVQSYTFAEHGNAYRLKKSIDRTGVHISQLKSDICSK